MGSNVLPQAVFMVPRNPTQWAPKKLASSAFLRAGQFNSPAIRLSRNSSCSFRTANLKRFVVRAEAEEGAAEEPAPEPEAGVETESEAEAEVATEEKPPRKPRIKLGEIMGILNKRAIEASDEQRPTPDLRPGDIVEIKLEVPENRRRLSVYKGIIISKQNAGIHTTIRIRRIIAGIGVEIVFPVYSPNVKEIRVVSHRKVRRAKLYYLRDKLPRLSTFK
ncbi:50S ribosomal protein L19-1, chloroplastic-like [Ipomoea triloba]|uniref:50S ribosomal protein L19-1, chloroplastic-like n=1 Tax=Ipomoea triloba TaxID=35885 RepID=UPI00125D295E|nr:50S ribosomal protein L19-1, chloroplastic-like [Ipomoea triloba]